MGKPIKYLNDRSFDNLLLILMHTYMDLKTLSSQVDISKNYLKTKIDCLEDVREAYFLKTEISQKEWDATVTICHSRTRDLESHVQRADIVIAAIGQPNFVTSEMLKKNAVIIDVGINRLPSSAPNKKGKLCGDVDFEAVFDKTRLITPVPGGVGPMTIAMLMRNTVLAARLQNSIQPIGQGF